MHETRTFPSEADIHAYVDGRLDEIGCRRIEAWMNQHPEGAQAIRGWQRDAEALRAAIGDLPSAEASTSVNAEKALDGVIVRIKHRRRVWRNATFALLLMLAVNVGWIAGWHMRELNNPTQAAPMADAVLAYRLFALNHHAPFDVTQTHAGELQAWLDQHFPRATRLPDLATSGFHLIGGRLLANTSGPAALVLYRDAEGDAVSFYIRLPGPDTGLLSRGARRDGRLTAAYWSAHGYNYALVGPTGVSDLRLQYKN